MITKSSGVKIVCSVEQVSLYKTYHCPVSLYLNITFLHCKVIQIETRDLRDTDALSASLLELNLDAASSHHKGAPLINRTQQDDVGDDVTEKTALTVPKS